MGEFYQAYEHRFPAAAASLRAAWGGLCPVYDLPREIRRVLSSTNMIESFNARVRSAVARHGHFPNDTAARKVVYLVVQGHGGWSRKSDPGRKVNEWKRVHNLLILHFGERLEL